MAKTPIKKTATRRKPRTKKKNTFWSWNKVSIAFGIVFVIFIFLFGYHYRKGLAYYLGFKTNKQRIEKEDKRITDVRNFELLSKYDDRVVGIDVSQYQGKINWKEVRTVENTFPIGFVFIRATVGSDKVDNEFRNNWMGSKENGIIHGAYHYYRPNENSLAQANNFIATVKLQKGDLPPVLDIEQLPKNQSLDSLKVGLRRWLVKVEDHYKIKPIIYSGEKYYDNFLKEEFSEYTFWIANYNFFVEDIKEDWLFWQFTEKATITGISGNVDLNIYNGTPKMLIYITFN